MCCDDGWLPALTGKDTGLIGTVRKLSATLAGEPIWTLSMIMRPSGPSTADISAAGPGSAYEPAGVSSRGPMAATEADRSMRPASRVLLRPLIMEDAARDSAACGHGSRTCQRGSPTATANPCVEANGSCPAPRVLRCALHQSIAPDPMPWHCTLDQVRHPSELRRDRKEKDFQRDHDPKR